MFLPYWVTALRTFFLATIAHLNSWFSKAWLHFFTLNLWGPEKPFTEERNGVSEHLQSYTVSKSVNAIWLTHEKRSLTWCKFHYYGENRRAETNFGFSAFHPGHSPPLTKLMEGGHTHPRAALWGQPGLLQAQLHQPMCQLTAPSWILMQTPTMISKVSYGILYTWLKCTEVWARDGPIPRQVLWSRAIRFLVGGN